MAEMQEQYMVDENGKKTAVLIPLDPYERLIDDLHGLATVAERRDEETANLEDVQQRLKDDGFLQVGKGGERIQRPIGQVIRAGCCRRLRNLCPRASRETERGTPDVGKCRSV